DSGAVLETGNGSVRGTQSGSGQPRDDLFLRQTQFATTPTQSLRDQQLPTCRRLTNARVHCRPAWSASSLATSPEPFNPGLQQKLASRRLAHLGQRVYVVLREIEHGRTSQQPLELLVRLDLVDPCPAMRTHDVVAHHDLALVLQGAPVVGHLAH